MTGTALTKVESKEFGTLETTIDKGLVTFYEVGSAFKTIRDSKFYRENFDTFEDYCRQRFGMEKSHTYRLIDCCELRDNLSPIGEVFPANEAQARTLTKLKPEQQQKVWQEVLDRAPETEDGVKLITAKIVSDAVSSMFPAVPMNHVRPFDLDIAGDNLLDQLRNTLDQWPEDLRSEAAHWIRQVLREYEL